HSPGGIPAVCGVPQEGSSGARIECQGIPHPRRLNLAGYVYCTNFGMPERKRSVFLQPSASNREILEGRAEAGERMGQSRMSAHRHGRTLESGQSDYGGAAKGLEEARQGPHAPL